MEAAITIGLLLLGFVFLIKGADLFVDGASAVAATLRVPTLIIGLTVVAMGTSLPELSVSVTASMTNSNSLAVSNVIGSNIFNLMVVLGASAIISAMAVQDSVLKKDIPFSIAITLFLAVYGYIRGGIDRVGGVILLVIFAAFIFVMIRNALRERRDNLSAADEGDEIKKHPILLSIIFIVGGVAMIKFGGDWVVDSAVTIAEWLGVSETLIGLTVVALGTSLPELVTSMVAAKKNELDMAVGNAVGSNIFNILMILGVAAAISPIALIRENLIDTAILLAFSLIVMGFAWTKRRLSRIEGIIMVGLYVAYLAYIILRAGA